MTETDLFGSGAGSGVVPRRRKPRRVTNDMDLVERVLRVACSEGYTLVGPAERVYRVGGKDSNGIPEITGVTAEEDDAVHQLIVSKDLTVGGQHCYRYRNHREGYGRSVLVPRSTRSKSARWGALHRPSTWSGMGVNGKGV